MKHDGITVGTDMASNSDLRKQLADRDRTIAEMQKDIDDFTNALDNTSNIIEEAIENEEAMQAEEEKTSRKHYWGWIIVVAVVCALVL